MNLEEAEALAKQLMQEHGVTDYRFEFNDTKRRLGQCDWKNKVINLSKSYTEINDISVVRNTILHEIAHALAGPGQMHGSKWRRIALSIGCNGERCAKNAISPPGKYSAICPGCNMSYDCFKKSKGACRNCCIQFNSGRYTDKFKLVYKIKEVSQ